MEDALYQNLGRRRCEWVGVCVWGWGWGGGVCVCVCFYGFTTTVYCTDVQRTQRSVIAKSKT